MHFMKIKIYRAYTIHALQWHTKLNQIDENDLIVKIFINWLDGFAHGLDENFSYKNLFLQSRNKLWYAIWIAYGMLKLMSIELYNVREQNDFWHGYTQN